MTPTPPNDEPTPDTRGKKPRRPEAWAFLTGLLILLPLLGYLLNQQQASPPTTDSAVEPAAPPAPTESKPEAAQRPTRRESGGKTADTRKPSQVVFIVTHKHRLRDCHGTLTFTREGLRFESDEPEDSFAVGRDDVTVQGDTLRIRDKTWRFDFDDTVRAERIFQDWKNGTLRLVSRP
jgi:hypothetical protein